LLIFFKHKYYIFSNDNSFPIIQNSISNIYHNGMNLLFYLYSILYIFHSGKNLFISLDNSYNIYHNKICFANRSGILIYKNNGMNLHKILSCIFNKISNKNNQISSLYGKNNNWDNKNILLQNLNGTWKSFHNQNIYFWVLNDTINIYHNKTNNFYLSLNGTYSTLNNDKINFLTHFCNFYKDHNSTYYDIQNDNYYIDCNIYSRNFYDIFSIFHSERYCPF
jgi:hypothetical protein